MAHADSSSDTGIERSVLVVAALCCAVPMTVIVVATSVLGLAFGPAVATALGVTAAAGCVAVMVRHRRAGSHHHGADVDPGGGRPARRDGVDGAG